MKTYVITTGTLFGLLTLAHLWRALVAEPNMARDPYYIAITLVAAGLMLWAWRVVRHAPR
ncbi:MAG: hypothetical protein ABI587_07775 [Gemmatimonadales bacterium]